MRALLFVSYMCAAVAAMRSASTGAFWGDCDAARCASPAARPTLQAAAILVSVGTQSPAATPPCASVTLHGHSAEVTVAGVRIHVNASQLIDAVAEEHGTHRMDAAFFFGCAPRNLSSLRVRVVVACAGERPAALAASGAADARLEQYESRCVQSVSSRVVVDTCDSRTIASEAGDGRSFVYLTTVCPLRPEDHGAARRAAIAQAAMLAVTVLCWALMMALVVAFSRAPAGGRAPAAAPADILLPSIIAEHVPASIVTERALPSIVTEHVPPV